MGARLALEALDQGAPFLSLTCLSTTLEVPDREKRILQEQEWIASLQNGSLKSFIDKWYQSPLFDSFTPPQRRYEQNKEDLIQVLQNYSILTSPCFKKIICQQKLPLSFLYREKDKKAAPLKGYKNLYFVPAKSHAIHLENPHKTTKIIKNILTS